MKKLRVSNRGALFATFLFGPQRLLHGLASKRRSTPHAYSSLFITPGLKLKLAPELPISPYFVGGIGYARFHQDSNALVTAQTVNKEVFDFGGGVDFKIAPFVSWRGEVRDFYSGLPNFNSLPDSGRQHNVVAQTGLVLRF